MAPSTTSLLLLLVLLPLVIEAALGSKQVGYASLNIRIWIFHNTKKWANSVDSSGFFFRKHRFFEAKMFWNDTFQNITVRGSLKCNNKYVKDTVVQLWDKETSVLVDIYEIQPTIWKNLSSKCSRRPALLRMLLDIVSSLYDRLSWSEWNGNRDNRKVLWGLVFWYKSIWHVGFSQWNAWRFFCIPPPLSFTADSAVISVAGFLLAERRDEGKSMGVLLNGRENILQKCKTTPRLWLRRER